MIQYKNNLKNIGKNKKSIDKYWFVYYNKDNKRQRKRNIRAVDHQFTKAIKSKQRRYGPPKTEF